MGRCVTKIRLPYVQAFRDRHGRPRYYFRRAGRPRIGLPGHPGSSEFMAAYREAVQAEPAAPAGGAPGTIAALVTSYYRSPKFRKLASSTQATYRGIIDRFREQHGHRKVATLDRATVQRLIDRMQDTPTAANNLLKVIRIIMRHAIRLDLRPNDPTEHVEPIQHRSDGFHTMTAEEMEAFEARWAAGTMQRLAFALLRYTGQRRSDVVRMGRQHVRDGVLTIRQQKTGTEVEIPVHPELAELLPSDRMTFLVTTHGRPFSVAGFGNWLRAAFDGAGLPHCSAHGVRKWAGAHLAEMGCTANQIMAVLGHTSLKEAERYTRKASRRKLGAAAIARIGRAEP